jgi:para-nitrobenzyl esterase
MTDDRPPAGRLAWVPSLAGTAALIALVLAMVVPLEAAQKEPVAGVTGGRVKGRLLSGKAGAVFKGIPFARPPVGALRWREPQRVERWKGVRDADEFCAPCAQAPAGWNDADAAISREDCLYLNVWTPAWPPRNGAPVMVWIHGGGNTAGTGGADPLYDGTRLIGRDVVLVTFEYRLGVFGFFAHPELTRESRRRASGNYGILDQIAALRWVRANIAAFGGDQRNVTVFGQSAGALDLASLMTTKLSKGLFQRGIGQSGAVLTVGPTATLAQAEEAGVKLASALRAPGTGALPFLRARSTAELLRAGGTGPAGINVDGWVFAKPPADVFAAGKQRSIPLILGSNAVEFDGPDSPASLRKTIEARYGALADRAYRLYGVSGPADEGKADPVYAGPSRQWAADTSFRCPTLIQSDWHSRARRATWVYQFDRAIPPRPVTAHSADLPYVFGNLYSKGSQAGEFTALDRKLSASIVAYWTNFARTGNPNGVGLPPWPRYDARSQQILEFTKAAVIVVGKDQRRSFCDLFRESLQQPAKAMPGRRGDAH